jgi:hypothetical protein
MDPRNFTRNGRPWPVDCPAKPCEDGASGTEVGVCDMVGKVWHCATTGTRLRKSEKQWPVASGQWPANRARGRRVEFFLGKLALTTDH